MTKAKELIEKVVQEAAIAKDIPRLIPKGVEHEIDKSESSFVVVTFLGSDAKKNSRNFYDKAKGQFRRLEKPEKVEDDEYDVEVGIYS